MNTETGRPLTDEERGVLSYIFSAPFPGSAELRGQLAAARVTKNWGPAGSPSIDIFVPADSPQAQMPDGPIPAAAQVVDPDGSYLGELIVWVTSGRISALEYSWITDEPPVRLPEESWIRISS